MRHAIEDEFMDVLVALEAELERVHPCGRLARRQQLGSRDVVVVNFPTIQYDHSAPDKLRLPLDTPEIAYRFEDRPGW